jgi:hypothetical protein
MKRGERGLNPILMTTQNDHLRREWAILAVCEIAAESEEEVIFYRNRRRRREVEDQVLEQGSPDLIRRLCATSSAKAERRRQENEIKTIARQRQREEEKNDARKRRRISDSIGGTERDLSLFLQLPEAETVQRCYDQFRQRTSNEALRVAVCAVCGREVGVHDDNVERMRLSHLHSRHRLVPSVPHEAHDLYFGLLLQPEGVEVGGSLDSTMVTVCGRCWGELCSSSDKPLPCL